jgi:hypothetical protein
MKTPLLLLGLTAVVVSQCAPSAHAYFPAGDNDFPMPSIFDAKREISPTTSLTVFTAQSDYSDHR